MGKIIRESDMDFIADNTFHMERSPLYTELSRNGIRTVEFIRVKGDDIIFLEAKTAFPKPDNNPSAEDPGRFKIALNEVCEKLIHLLNLYSSIKVGVRKIQLPEDFLPPDKVTLKFVLVVKNHELEWCRIIKDALIMVMPSYINKIWQPEVYVINHDTAIKKKLAIMR